MFAYVLMTEDAELIAASDSMAGAKRAAMEWAFDANMQIVSDWAEDKGWNGHVFWRLEATALDLEPGESFDAGLILEMVDFYPSNED
jgi:hypothetical protein